MREAIKNYLDSIENEHFKMCYAREDKNLDQCLNYIMNKAKESLKGANGFIEDETVYHLAREYYEEDKIDEKLLSAVNGGVNAAAKNEPKAEKVEKPKAAKKPKKEQVNENQCDLFGGLDFDFGVS